jgi:hypothetical protein
MILLSPAPRRPGRSCHSHAPGQAAIAHARAMSSTVVPPCYHRDSVAPVKVIRMSARALQMIGLLPYVCL